jgi:hypothetical protein
MQAFPTCALTAPYVSKDGLVWGGVNSGGSITTIPNTALTWTGTGVMPYGNVIGTWTQFILPEYTSASCRFNISLGTTVGGGRGGAGGRGRAGWWGAERGLGAGLRVRAAPLLRGAPDWKPPAAQALTPPPPPAHAQNPGVSVVATPMLNWGFGGQYILNQPQQMTVNFRPMDKFFPVGGCLTVTNQVRARGAFRGGPAGGPGAAPAAGCLGLPPQRPTLQPPP